jgi:hypothetical protein
MNQSINLFSSLLIPFFISSVSCYCFAHLNLMGQAGAFSPERSREHTVSVSVPTPSAPNKDTQKAGHAEGFTLYFAVLRRRAHEHLARYAAAHAAPTLAGK